MRRFILATWRMLALASPTLADSVRCTTRQDPLFKRWLTTCTDGARAITAYDAQFQRDRTDVITPPTGDKPPRGWLTPGQPPR